MEPTRSWLAMALGESGMSFITKPIERIFTPPGTGGLEAAAQRAAGEAAKAQARALPSAPSTPEPPKAPPAAAAFSPTAVAQRRSQIGAATPSILGAAAVAGTTKKPTLG